MRTKKEMQKAEEFLIEAIKLGIDIDLQKEDDEPVLSDEDMIKAGYSLPPDDMYSKIIKECQNDLKIRRVFSWKKVVMLAAIITTLLFGILNIQAIRAYIHKLTVEISENSIKISGTPNSPSSKIFEGMDYKTYEEIEEELGETILKPLYIPEGFAFEAILVYKEERVSMIYTNEKEEHIGISQSFITDETVFTSVFDTKDGEVKNKTINGHDILFVYTKQDETNIKWVHAIWTYDKTLYKISTNLSEKEIIKIIKNLK